MSVNEDIITVEFSKDINSPEIGIIGAFENDKKVVNLYKVDRNKYKPKLKVKEVSRNVDELKELAHNSELLCKLVFNNDSSIESLIYILSSICEVKQENKTEHIKQEDNYIQKYIKENGELDEEKFIEDFEIILIKMQRKHEKVTSLIDESSDNNKDVFNLIMNLYSKILNIYDEYLKKLKEEIAKEEIS